MRRQTVWRAAGGLAGLLFSLAWAMPARAECTDDTDCPTATCGGQVCQWSASGHNCVAAGTDAVGTDGWCNTDANCKCMAEGATCQAASFHCTFTLPPDSGSAAADSGTVSTSSSGGGYSSSGSASGGGGYSSGAATGSSSGGGSSGQGGTLPDADVQSGSTSSGNSGGCAVSAAGGDGSAASLALAGMAVLAIGLGRRRRR